MGTQIQNGLMKIAIIGWYGTETIGDRAILAGLFHLFAESYGKYEVRLGCLDTLLTERTLDDDSVFFTECSNYQLGEISLFDSRKKRELDNAVVWCDILAIGGGPLMELDAMYRLLYAFKRAKRLGKKCIVAGCGMGPFKSAGLLDVATQLVELSDVAIFRDRKSQEIFNNNSRQQKDTLALIDPAAIASLCYLDKHRSSESYNYIAINFRKPPVCEYDGLKGLHADYFTDILKSVANVFDGEIRLVPMHCFDIGGDDRYFLNKVARLSGLNNVFVHNRPLSLEETFVEYHRAAFCIGMRFHAVLLQTFLNGKNFVLDYTDPEKGKIISLLRQLSLIENLENRYVSLVNRPANITFNFLNVDKIEVAKNTMNDFKNNYIQSFKSVF